MSSVGTVKFFNTASGYGFIAPKDGSKEVVCAHPGSRTRGIDVS